LQARQMREDDPEVLPRLELADVPETLSIPEGTPDRVGELPCDWFDRPTNGLVYQQALIDLPLLQDDELELLPLLVSCMAEVGSAGRDYLETQALMAGVTGGIGCYAGVHSAISEDAPGRGMLTVSGKALARNQGALAKLLRETLDQARFDETNRLRELVSQMRAAAELRIGDAGHQLALSAASAGLSPVGALSDRWHGMPAMRRLKELDRALEKEHPLEHLSERLDALARRLRQGRPRLFVAAEGEHFDSLSTALSGVWEDRSGELRQPGLPLSRFEAKQCFTGWVADAHQVCHCAKAYRAVPYSHPDAPVLTVLGVFLRNGYLHRAIREQGGAYGGGAGYDSDSRAFRFYSYRDPHLTETLDHFDRSLEWLESFNHTQRSLEEAILGVVGSIDKPGSPAGEAKRAYHDRLNGRTPEERRGYRSRVLQTGIEDLKRVARLYLRPEQASIGLVGPSRLLESSELPLVIERLV
ncbi:MAG: peptidase M16, partial [Magnetococcales bacterium]|nr:peptidase M16 [Magnetococcales bacterium]